MQQKSDELPDFSPSFSSYSSETLAEIAARVINELRLSPQNDEIDADNHNDDPFFQSWEDEFTSQNDDRSNQNDDNENENDDDFSFALVSRNAETSPVSADDIFYNGQIKPMYPLFSSNYNYAPLNDAVSHGSINNNVPNSGQNETIRRRLPLRKLMFEERETASCSSSDESVDLEGVPEDTYCVWNPNTVARDRKKSKSTGSGSSSKRWKLRELLLRSLSEGKGNTNNGKGNTNNNNGGGEDGDKKRAFVFGVPGKRTSKVAAAKNGSGDSYGGASEARQRKTGKKSVLPSRKELVGIFNNANGLGRNLPPF